MNIQFKKDDCFPDHGVVIITKEKDDPKYYKETTFWHALKKELLNQGYDVIKKLMWKDGHLVDSDLYYIRTRKIRGKDSFYIYQNDGAIRLVFEDFNNHGTQTLEVKWDIWE